MPNGDGGPINETPKEALERIFEGLLTDSHYLDLEEDGEIRDPSRDLAILQEAKKIKKSKKRFNAVKKFLEKQATRSEAQLKRSKKRIKQLQDI